MKRLISVAILGGLVAGAASAADAQTKFADAQNNLSGVQIDTPGFQNRFAVADQLAQNVQEQVSPTYVPPNPPFLASLPSFSKPGCFDSVWTYLKSSVKDCPLSWGPFTFYGNLDGGYGWSQFGAPLGRSADKANYFIQKNSRDRHWLWSPNAASTSVAGIALEQKLQGEWNLIGVVEGGFNPYSLMLINGPRSLADNNLVAQRNQRTAFDSSRAGQIDNSQGYIGASNPIYGTLTFGRTNSLSQSAIGAFDPVQSIAFSQIGFSGVYAGFGASPETRINTALTYRLTYQGIRLGAQMQVGGYSLGNAATNEYQVQVGTDLGNFSFDAIAGYAKNAVTLSSFSNSGLPVGFDPNSVLKATLSDTGGFALLSRYNWKPYNLKLYLGYIYSHTTDPSDSFPNGFPTVASGIINIGGSTLTSNNFGIPRDLNTVWTGAKYALRPNIDLAGGVYFEHQNDFNPVACTGSGVNTSNARCAGNRWSFSFLVDYRPIPRLSLYGGVMLSKVSGGIAAGFFHDQNIDPTVGVRIRF